VRPASRAILAITVVTILGFAASSAVLLGGLVQSHRTSLTAQVANLPSGCAKPQGGFLVIASEYGYNDSVLEGAGPAKHWPVINVTLGQSVKIVVCNVDKIQSHGFQIGNYFDSTVESIAPEQVITVSFVADKAGDFPIYCDIFCSIHLFMQYGELRVLS